jgi:ectoine hydroxylase-related dioxygenase (phytanoyl-CoA dioxygenase family)
VYGALHRTAHWHGENELVVRPGSDDMAWLGARAPHLDFPFAMPVRTLANNVLYLSDVEEFGGALMYWPGSHRVAWDYFRRNPPDYLAQGERSQDQVFQRLLQEVPNDPVQFTGRAGDLLIWHSLLLHSASVNKRPSARVATFGRWGIGLGDEPFYDFGSDMWSYWDFAPTVTAAREVRHAGRLT